MKKYVIACLLLGLVIPITITIAYHPSPIEHQTWTKITISTPTTPTPTALMPLQNKRQVEQFMLADTTDQHPYTSTYQCGNYSADVVANASKLGIEAQVVIVVWKDHPITHAIVLFPTVDDGDVYVDATAGDYWVDFKGGEGNYNSYSMQSPVVYGFHNLTIYLYGITDEYGSTHWLSIPTPIEATPEPESTPIPTIIPILLPTPIVCPRADCTTPDSSGIIRCNPTPLQNKEEVKQFMEWDTTDTHLGYNCRNFANDVCDNASNHEIEAHPVIIWFSDGTIHEIVEFPTVEDGNVFIDTTQSDWWAGTVEVGQQYNPINFYSDWSYYGTTVKIVDRIMIYD